MHAGNRINQYEIFLPPLKFPIIKEKNEMKFAKKIEWTKKSVNAMLYHIMPLPDILYLVILD
jgi:hypothetical protein